MKLGPLIGEGKCRRVFEHPDDPTLVIKVTRKSSVRPESNRIEWLVWQAVRGTPLEKHFCPCVELTEEGHLIMVRCKKGSRLSKKLHLNGVTLEDSRKPANRGELDNRQVLLDYGHPSALLAVKSLTNG